MRLAQLVDRLFTETKEKDPDSVGRRRWMFLTKQVIGGNGKLRGVPLLTRYRLVQSPYGGVYVHHIHRPDVDRDCHNHPWRFWTFVLRGGYVEEYRARAEGGSVMQVVGTKLGSDARRWRHFPLEAAHRITHVRHGGAWTLVLVGPKARDWGFFVHRTVRRPGESTTYSCGAVYIPWQTYIAQGGSPDPFNC